MKNLIKKAIRIAFIPFVIGDYFKFKEKDKNSRFALSLKDFYPQIKDKTVKTGFDRHYVYHTSWAVRKVKEIDPAFHIDIGSTLFFAGTLSAFIPVDFYDYRPATLTLSNLKSLQGDLQALPFADESVESISCMHTIEHIGLGRYGDPIDPEGDIKAINELKRVVKKGGSFLFVTPMGAKNVIEWNAHRIYTYQEIMRLMEGLTLKEFSLIPEHEKDGGIIINADPELLKNEHYAAGCFWFTK